MPHMSMATMPTTMTGSISAKVSPSFHHAYHAVNARPRATAGPMVSHVSTVNQSERPRLTLLWRCSVAVMNPAPLSSNLV